MVVEARDLHQRKIPSR